MSEDISEKGFGACPLWWVGVAGLLLAQAGLALSLFGGDLSLLSNDDPIVSGRHPLHLYHASLGSETFVRKGTTACFDPWFQAGYLKTPVFDGGCRPAEVMLALAGGGYDPAAYKWGWFASLVLMPLAYVLAGRGLGFPAGASCLAGVAGLTVLWTDPVRNLFDSGDLDILAAGLAGMVFVAWLARYTTQLALDAWFVLAFVSVVGWYCHPLIWLSLLPLVTLYYLVYAPRHGLGWHLGLLGAGLVGLAPSLWWLWDWGRYWWLRQPSRGETPAGWEGIWEPLVTDGTLGEGVPGGWLTLILGVVGLGVLIRNGYRAGAWLVPLVFVGAWLGYRWLGGAESLPPAVRETGRGCLPLFMSLSVVAAAGGVWGMAERLGGGNALAALAVAGAVLVGWWGSSPRPLAKALGWRTEPLVIGLDNEQRAIVAAIRELTTPDARILWDERNEDSRSWNWSALLAQLTGRGYLGGLDAEAGVEHSFCCLMNGRLAGQSLEHWSDSQLAEFCRKYNVGWVAARSSEAMERWSRCGFARETARLPESGREWVLYELNRPRSYVLCGSATWDEASPQRICLSNVAPDARGRVELSLHYHQELKVYPSYVRIDAAGDASDPIDRVRLSLPGPLPRVMIIWEP